jgi:hypothetical protein
MKTKRAVKRVKTVCIDAPSIRTLSQWAFKMRRLSEHFGKDALLEFTDDAGNQPVTMVVVTKKSVKKESPPWIDSL